MKVVLIKDNYIIDVIYAPLPESTLRSILAAHNIEVDRIMWFPDEADISVGDDIRSFNAAGCRLEAGEIAALQNSQLAEGTVAVLFDDGWKIVPSRRGWVYVVGDHIVRIERDWDDIPESAEVFESYTAMLRNSLHGCKVAAKMVVRAHAEEQCMSPLTYKGAKVSITTELLHRLHAVSMLEDMDTPWVIYESTPMLTLTPTDARELLTAIVGRNETYYQWAASVIANEIMPAVTTAEVCNIMRAHNLYEKLEGLYG